MKRIGFLTANLHIGSSRSLWPGLVDAAERLDTNLVCYVGGGLGSTQAGVEAQRNSVYELVDPASLDGLISWTSTIGASASPEEVLNFHRRFQPLPVLTLSHLEGFPEVAVDSYQGMRTAMQHLIAGHGYRRLALVRGPERHFYAQERYRAYRDALSTYGIPLDPLLVTRPLPWDAGAEAAAILLDERGLRPGRDFEALVTVSDNLALSAMQVLQLRGYRVPQDVAVIGMNDTIESRLSFPPLTSVALPFYQQGARALELLAGSGAGPGNPFLPERTMLASHLVIRQSCGCPSPAVLQARAGEHAFRGALEPAGWRALAGTVLSEAGPQAAQAGCDRDQVQVLLDALASPHDGRFLKLLENMLDQAAHTGSDPGSWQSVISALRRTALPHLDGAQRSAAEDLFGQGRVLVSEKAQRELAYQQLQNNQQANLLRRIGQELITTFEISRLADALARSLPQVGIPGCYLALYQSPKQSLEQASLVAACTSRGLATFEQGGLPFPARQLLPDGILAPNRRVSLVVQPLYFEAEPIGFVLFEVGTRNGLVYETLRGHLSSALKGALLIKDAQRARAAAEKADAIKTRLLANVSHELRTPLNIIIENAQRLRSSQDTASPEEHLHQIEQHARHQLRVINDLLDLSRAEIDELDLYLEIFDPRTLLEDAFHSMAGSCPPGKEIEWRMELPARLPGLRADPVRLRQILLNLLSNACKFTRSGHIALGAEVLPPNLHMWVSDSGPGIPADQQQLIFEPFVTVEGRRAHLSRADSHGGPDAGQGGIGLGLSITRRLVALHGGTLTIESQPGHGSTFHVFLPLPRLQESHPMGPQALTAKTVLLVSSSDQPAQEVLDFCQRGGFAICRIDPDGDLNAQLEAADPAAIAWDLSLARPGDWRILRRLHNHPRCGQAPFLLYGQPAESQQAEPQQAGGQLVLAVGLTAFITRPAGLSGDPGSQALAPAGQSLLDLLEAARMPGAEGPILIVDDDPQVRADISRLLDDASSGYSLETASNGLEAVALMEAACPSLVILDLMMPEMDGFDVLDWMRAQPVLRGVPVVIVSSKLLSLADVHRLEKHAQVRFQRKGLLSPQELNQAVQRALAGADVLPPHTSALVKQALAYIHHNYTRPLARWEIAQAAGASEDYLGRVFRHELGLSPWDYLNRCRIQRAQEILMNANDTIRAVAHQVGFKDAAYFSRVFHKLTGVSPADFRKGNRTE